MSLACDQLIAAAEIAELMTEGNMDIQRQWALRVARSRALERSFVVALVKLQRGGV
ncbi:hypothetical protein D3C80_1947920 [compost metagenome]